ncbi:insulin-like growth factor 1 receptor [Rhynchophorus ferrugineus]|uniref:insulin-like growth factor 1 receptor n=1 Tax=Rhynchophorus ferrugineus TaxID=354439 RepID=UPI003FCECBAF
MRCAGIVVVFGVLVISATTPVSGKICDSIDVRNNITFLNKLRNCTEISGNLQIVLIETTKSVEDYDDYVFPELTRVSGYVLFFKVRHITSIGKLFPNLRVIRGLELIFDYSFILNNLPNLREIGTNKLLYIARGSVHINKTPKLCYAKTIDWQKIGSTTKLDIYQSREDCKPCPEQCNKYCWNSNHCQIQADDCHEECLGCTRNQSNAHCEVCKNYEDDGICVPECPPKKYMLRAMHRCITTDECLALNNHTGKTFANKKWLVYDRECRGNCPTNTEYQKESNTCRPCDNFCTKNCTATELNNQNSIANLRGCTHISGSISIVGLNTEEDLRALRDSLQSVRYISDYLLIARNKVIRNLDFLSNLRVINGNKKTTNRTLLVYENPSLKRLWHDNVSLKINGRILFNDNKQLCLDEIDKLIKKSNITHSITDVSANTNGVSCSIPKDDTLPIKVTVLSSDNVTLEWQPLYNDILYYTVYYSDRLETTENMCSDSGWVNFITLNTTAELSNLTAYTTYYYYLQIFRQSRQSETPVYNFTTWANDPDQPKDFLGRALDHQSIKLIWGRPEQIRGELDNYIITVYREDYDRSYINQRDYCQNPHSPDGASVDKPDDADIKIYEEALTSSSKVLYDPNCPTPFELNIELVKKVWLRLCDEKSQSKYGFDDCKNYYYQRVNYSDIAIQKRSGMMTMTKSKKKTSLDLDKGRVFSIVAGANQTTTVVKNLRQFTVYVFYIMACNRDLRGRKLCSPVLQTSVRTDRSPRADDIPDSTIRFSINQNDVVIAWSEPTNPNAFIVSYNIIYERSTEHSKPVTICVPEERYKADRSYTLKGMLPGSYYVMLQAVSLAGPGNYSRKMHFDIGSPASSPFWLIFTTVLLFLLGVAGFVTFFRIKRKKSREHIQLIASINPDYVGLLYVEDEWEMDRRDVELRKEVGKGTFGTVYIGFIKSKSMLCAIKTVHETASIQERINFLTEASVMKQFSNAHHVVKLFGVVSRDQPPLVVMELMERGDLKQYLQRLRDSSQNFASNEIYRMAIEIADGLAYLTSKKYVHRDLAARNCMVAHDRTVKIGDFGMTRDIYENDYYKKGTRGLLPVRWMAPESLADGVFTSDSDIWSYGIVLWEISTLAEQPYQGLVNEQVLQFIISQGKLERPVECPNLLWEIMSRCWEWYPRDRPTCFEVVETLQDQVGQDFRVVSYCHSKEGQEFLFTQGSARPNNPPALTSGVKHL